MPTKEHTDEEIEEMYERIEELFSRETKGKDYTVVTGDWNAVVGETREENVGEYGLGSSNKRGEKLIELCRNKKIYVTNTWFCQNKRRRYTWTRPGNTGRFQIDYILAKQRYWNSVINAKCYPGADVDSDHNPVVITVKIKLKKIIKAEGRHRRDTEKLKDFITAIDYK